MAPLKRSFSDVLSDTDTVLTKAAIDDIIHGVAAAPEGHDPQAWHSLITETPSSALRQAWKIKMAWGKTQEKQHQRPQ